MDQSYFTCFNGMFSLNIYEVDDYVDPSFLDQYNYYGTTQSTSFSGGYLYDNQGHTYGYGAYHYEYHPEYYYEYQTYVGYYPLTNLQYSNEYLYWDNYVYVPVNIYYYVPTLTYFTTEETYNVSDIAYLDPDHSYENEIMSSTFGQTFDTFEEFNDLICNIGNSSTEIVGEEQTTFQVYYVEPQEVLNDAPVDDEAESGLENESESSAVENESESSAVNEVNDVQSAVPGPSSSSVDRDAVEENNNENTLESLSESELRELKADISRAYTHLKENLLSDVENGYSDMREFLENIKWRWDRHKWARAKRIEEEKVKKTYDMKNYYFHDDLSVLSPSYFYEEDLETYVLYEILRSLNLYDLKKFMKIYYDFKKKKVYEDECKGYQKTQSHLARLKWQCTSLCTIRDDERLIINEKDYRRNFKRGLRNITSENFSKLSHLLLALNRPVLLSSTSSEEELDYNEEYIHEDSEETLDNTELPDSASYGTVEDVAGTSSDVSSREDPDSEFWTAIRDLRLLASPSYQSVDVEKDPVPPEKEISERQSVERINIVNQNSVFSGEDVEEPESLSDRTVIENDSFREVELFPESRTSSDREGPETVEEEQSPNGEESDPAPIVIKQAVAEKKHPKKRFSSLRKFMSRICCCCKKKPPPS